MLGGSQAISSSKMTPSPRVVFVTRYYPYPQRAGAFIYTAQMIDLWAAIGGQVDVFCARQSGTRASPGCSERQNVKFHFGLSRATTVWGYLASREPKSASDFSIAANLERLSQLLIKIKPDIVVVDHIGSTWCMPAVLSYKSRFSSSMPVIYTTHNEETSTRLSIARQAGWLHGLPHIFDAIRIYFRDRQMLRNTSIVTCNTDHDKRKYLRLRKLPTAILSPLYTRKMVESRSIDVSVPREIAIVSGFKWSAKVLNLEHFLRAAENTLRDAGISLSVIGRMDEVDKERLSRAYPWANFYGEVDSVEPYLSGIRLGLLIDQAGGGFKHSMLTYAFNRIPVAALESAVSDNCFRDHALVSRDIPDLLQNVVATIDDFETLNKLQSGMFLAAQIFRNGERNRRALSEVLTMSGVFGRGIAT